MAADSKAWQVRQKVAELSSDYFRDLKEGRLSLAEHFIKTARKNRKKPCISDSTGANLNYGRTLLAAVALRREINGKTKGQERVGIMLPPSVGAVLANIAVTMLGKVTVNLNYAVSEQMRDSAISQCEIKTIITSRKFVEKSGIKKGSADFVFIEDIIEQIDLWSKVFSFFKALLLPCSMLVKGGRNSGNNVTTIIFSSGSNGEPKGVMLSHRNIYCNIKSLRSVFQLYKTDNLCAVLPFFRSFGFTCSLWLPIISGVSASYAPNPLDCDIVGCLARENKSTVLFAAPTFLVSFAKRIERKDFATIRAVVVGAEKMRKSVADTFEEKFGIRPQEGYGATELSPVVSLNVRNVEAGGIFQIGTKENTVGHPIPGVAVRIVDIDTNQTVPPGQRGLLMIKGPNVMSGYFNKPQETEKVLIDGWYNTGDIASIDEDGFLTITDRLSRFSKIGGEMVPHLRIEEIFHRGLETDEQLVAVTSVPGEKRAEELVVLYLEQAGNADKLYEIISKSNLPNIWKPHRENYKKIESMPVLGSGKLDIMRLKKMAIELTKK
jgi:acyl-[acyl-carrier-protein]-phospholipid O-acyltransferase/long-chain-fatty-acid--[acyl-carrier-protein] ligase